MSAVADFKDQLELLDVDAKRKPGAEEGLESWYPYYAGYTEEFARTVISAANLPENAVVMDPWNGCGTTTCVADRMGYDAIGFDINPVAVLVASAKFARAKDASGVFGLVDRIAKSALEKPARASKKDPLRSWLRPGLVAVFRVIEREIISDLASPDNEPLNPTKEALPPLASFLLLALHKSARELAGIKISSNPTWLRPKEKLPRHKKQDLTALWLSNVQSMADDLGNSARHQHNASPSINFGDSRDIALESNSVDLIVTSPPYCTRIDYVINTSFELAALGITEEGTRFDELRRGCMGTPLARKQTPPESTEFPDAVASVLRKIKQHPSKASGTYYYKTYAQYFLDAYNSLKEIERVLKSQQAAVLVVQSSYYKDVYIDLPELYCELARELDMTSSIAAEFDVTKFLAQINTRSTAHRKSTNHSESVIVLEAS